MSQQKLGKLELKVMRALWEHGALSVREIQETLPAKKRPAYTTVQTIASRLEAKKAIRRTKKIGNAHIFEAVLSKNDAESRLVDDLLGAFGGQTQPLISHLIESGRLTLEDIEAARNTLHELSKKE